jgi:acyl-CoA reductase-like NAD-dependent aldehyde dehydrogenase
MDSGRGSSRIVTLFPLALVMTEESYGPIAAVRRVRDESEALALSNALPFGLAAYVYKSGS